MATAPSPMTSSRIRRLRIRFSREPLPDHQNKTETHQRPFLSHLEASCSEDVGLNRKEQNAEQSGLIKKSGPQLPDSIVNK